MFCDKCGAPVEEGQVFCHSCGKRLQPEPAATGALAEPSADPTQNRVVQHTRILAILWIIWSAFHLLPAVAIFSMGSFAMPFMHGFGRMPFFGPLMAGIGTLIIIASVFGIAAGWGLLSYQPWARMLAIVLGCFALISIPFGTALGIYTLWVLLPGSAEQEYERLSQKRA